MKGESPNRGAFRTLAGALWFWIRACRWSVIAFVGALVLGLFSMGFLGIGLYWPVAPVLMWRFPSMDKWTGDWVWPAVIAAGMLWSFGFLLAGAINYHLISQRTSVVFRRSVYLGVLWLWDLTVWFLLLRFPPN